MSTSPGMEKLLEIEAFQGRLRSKPSLACCLAARLIKEHYIKNMHVHYIEWKCAPSPFCNVHEVWSTLREVGASGAQVEEESLQKEPRC